MKRVLFFASMFLFFYSCTSSSNWEELIIPSNQALIFSEPDSPNVIKHVLVLVKEDTMVIHNYNHLYKICYLKMAFPEKNIIIEYIKRAEGDKIIYEPRFINLQQEP